MTFPNTNHSESMVLFFAFPVFIVRIVTHTLIVDMCFISFTEACSLVASPIVDIIAAKMAIFRVSYKKGNK